MSSTDTAEKPQLPGAKDRKKLDLKASNVAEEEAPGSEAVTGDKEMNGNGKDPLAAQDVRSIEPENTKDQAEAKKLENGTSQNHQDSAPSDAQSSDSGEAKESDNSSKATGEKEIKAQKSNKISTSPFMSRQQAPDNAKDLAGGSEADDVQETPVKPILMADLPTQKEAGADELKSDEIDQQKILHDLAERVGSDRIIPPRIIQQLSRRGSPLNSQELGEPESRLDASTLAESLGRSSSRAIPKTVEEPDVFTDESLQSAETEKQAERPMSPSPAPAFAEGDLPAPVEPEEYQGLVYYDGVDSLGRPVVIINSDVLPRSASRKAAVSYLLQRLEPIVTQGPYVAIFLNTGEKTRKNRMPAGWLASCYRQMSYPFKKNVKFVILVRPSFTLNFMLTLIYPLLSKKAHAKIKKVENLSGLDKATNSEVSLQHLGFRFNTVAANSIIAGEGPGYGQGAAYQMPSL